MVAFRLEEEERGRRQSGALCTANPLGALRFSSTLATSISAPSPFHLPSLVRGTDGASVRAYGAICRTERYDGAAEVDLTNNRSDSRI